jgi:hypothetical protein
VIEGIDNLLEESGQAGLVELRELLEEILSRTTAAGQFLDQHTLPARRPRVYRLRFSCDGRVRSLVAKCMELDNAQRNRLAIRRWLPAIGLSDNTPTLLGVAVERSGECAWHVYDDLGDRSLDTSDLNPQHLQAAVELIAQVHMRSAGQPLLAECRLLGSDFGINFYSANLRDAVRGLEALQLPAAELPVTHSALLAHLLGRLRQLQDEEPMRARILEEFGGPETLLHGDLWPVHLFMLRLGHRINARLVGWDHAGVGPISYDLSTFLLRFPPRDRLRILDLYREAVRPASWTLPSDAQLNVLFETAEFARYANCLIWPAVGLVHDHLAWGFDELARVAQWFESWNPVLPEVFGSRLKTDLRLN